MSKSKNKQGGARQGAGRKRKEPTTTLRIPTALVSQVKKIIENHKKKASTATDLY